MTTSRPVYDIRTTELAQETLKNITEVPISVWKQHLEHEDKYKGIDNLIEAVIKSYGRLPHSYKDFQFIYLHVTTSANRCESIRKQGLLDLKHAYSCPDSELRTFLHQNSIHIDLDERLLKYKDRTFDITFGACPRQDTLAYKCWSVGRKFYYDYTTCGFLSVWERSPYGGQVHRRPELLFDIDELLNLDLSREWESTHNAYEVVAKVSGEDIIFDGDDYQNDECKVLMYLTYAYQTAFGEPLERILLIENNIQIPPSNILEINPLEYW